MHLIETYSLSAGAKIGKPEIYTTHFPIPFQKYITFQPKSQYDSKNYDFWQECINIILPTLNKLGITIIQLGDKNDQPISGTHFLSGQTTINQVAGLIQNSILHFGSDSFMVHIASAFNKKIVSLYSNNYIKNVRPFWTKNSDCVLIEPPNRSDGVKPSFVANEAPKTINSIKPEIIARAILKLLGEELDYPYTSLYIGPDYNRKVLEMIPSNPINPSTLGVNNMIVRMDLMHNEKVLIQQLQVIPCSIITRLPISEEILKQFKSRITQFVYIIDENHSPVFADFLKNLGISYILFSDKSPEWLNTIKLDYIENKLIISNPAKKDFIEISELKSSSLNKLFYKSNKFLLDNGKIYPSIAAWKENITTDNINCDIYPLINNELFWSELQSCIILEKCVNS